MRVTFAQIPSFLNLFLNIFLPLFIWQTVVNFISELQEQMCQFQKEINSKIQEKKALEIPTDSRFPMVCPTESTEGQGPTQGVSCDRTSGGMHKLEEASDGPDGNAHSLREGSSDAEHPCHCGEESVGTAWLHGLFCCVQHGCVKLSFT